MHIHFFYTDSCSATVFYFHSEVKTYWWGRDQDFFYVQNETEITTFLELYILDRNIRILSYNSNITYNENTVCLFGNLCPTSSCYSYENVTITGEGL